MIRYEDIKINLIAVSEAVLEEICGGRSEAIWYLDKVEEGEVWCVYDGAWLDSDLVFELEVIPSAILQIDDDDKISWWEQRFIYGDIDWDEEEWGDEDEDWEEED